PRPPLSHLFPYTTLFRSESGHIYLYGQSGGGFLVHQFLSIFGQYVDKAFTGAAVNYFLDAELGINHDKFWEEAIEQNPAFITKRSEEHTSELQSRENLVC